MSQICIGIIKTGLDRACDVFENKLRSVTGREVVVSHGKIDWSAFFEEKGSSFDVVKAQIALFPNSLNVGASEEVIYSCNLADGWYSVFENVMGTSNLTGFFFRMSLSDKARYRVYEMGYWECGEKKRHVRALEDDTGWTFLNKGVPLEFEDPSRYHARTIRSRLDESMIIRYSKSAGYDLTEITKFGGICCHLRQCVQ
jgi:hypothetical protein